MDTLFPMVLNVLVVAAATGANAAIVGDDVPPS